MAKAAQENIALSMKQFEEFDNERSEKINATEEKIDCLTDRADHYLIALSSHIKSAADKRYNTILMQCLSDIERIGDYASNFDELAKKKAAIEKELEAEINKRKSIEYYEAMAKEYSDNPKLAELVAELKQLGM